MDKTGFAAMAIVTVAGSFVRGTTGFGGAMLMTPVLYVLSGPVQRSRDRAALWKPRRLS